VPKCGSFEVRFFGWAAVAVSTSIEMSWLNFLLGNLLLGPVAGLVGIEVGVVSEVTNLESSGVGAPDRRPRHDQQYHEDGSLTG